MIRKHVIVSGKVQGVYFRKYTQEKADAFGLTGWVRNNSDGTVELEAQGTEETMPLFLEAIKTGSSASRVDDLAIRDMTPLADEHTFDITTMP